MDDKFDKCRFYLYYDDFEGCSYTLCEPCTHSFYEPDKNKIIEAAREMGLSVIDLIALIEL